MDKEILKYKRLGHEKLLKRATELGVRYHNGKPNEVFRERLRQVANESLAEMLCVLNKQDPGIEENMGDRLLILNYCKSVSDMERVGIPEYLIYKYLQTLDELHYYEPEIEEYARQLVEGRDAIYGEPENNN